MPTFELAASATIAITMPDPSQASSCRCLARHQRAPLRSPNASMTIRETRPRMPARIQIQRNCSCMNERGLLRRNPLSYLAIVAP